MAKQSINVGATANDKKGDSLRAAFQKVNNNFTELYTALGLNDNSLNLGAFEFNDSVMTTTDSTAIVIDQATTVTSDLTVGGNIVPSENLSSTLGSPTNKFHSLYVGTGSVYIGDARLSLEGGTLNSSVGFSTDNLTVGGVSITVNENGALLSSGGFVGAVAGAVEWDNVQNKPEIPSITGLATEDYVDTAISNIPVVDLSGYALTADIPDVSNFITAEDIPAIPADISDLTDTEGLLGSADTGNWSFNSNILSEGGAGDAVIEASDYAGAKLILQTRGLSNKQWAFDQDGGLTLPEGGDILDSEGNSVLGGGSITVGDGTTTSVSNVTEILINGAITEIEPGVVGITVSGGSSTTELAYLELTQTPFIVQPVVSGTPVTVTSPAQGQGAQVEIVIGAGPVITSVTVTTAGTGYAVGQRYRVWYYNAGGNNDDSNIDFEVATVGGAGELLTVTNAAFTGVGASNTPNTYSGVSIELRSSLVFDEIGPGLTLTRDRGRALYNTELELEYDRNNYTSPLGTEWNNDGWDNLVGFGVRNYTTFRAALNNLVGENIIGAELIMRDIANNRYYKFSFSVWGENNGAYTYTRTEITDPNFFEKLDYATANNVDVIEDDSTLQIGITRGEQRGIYNPFTEDGWDSGVSPQGTLWNIDGWDDLADVETRTYTNFYSAYGNGGLGNKVPRSRAVMYVPSIEKYYAIQWFNWTQNNQGGGFSYLRYELDLTKLQEGVRFADGTVQKTAYVPTNVKLRSPGERRIEEAYGYKEVAVTTTTTGNTITTTAANSNNSGTWQVDIVATGAEFDALIALNQGDAFYQIEISADENIWITGRIGGYNPDAGTIQIVFNDGATLAFDENDTVYYRILSGGDPMTWWDKNELPGGSSDFRGAVIDYHAYIPGRGTIVGTIHIVDDDGDENITHTEVSSGLSDLEYSDLWYVTSEGEIQYRQLDNNSRTLKIQWTAKVFYGSEYYND